MAKTYADRCGIARALDVVGDRWTLLIVRELLLGPKRFTDLQAGLPKVATDMLTVRLRDLTAAGLVERTTLPAPGAARVYALTDRGRDLEPVLLALGRFGSTLAMPAADDASFGADAAIIALPTTFLPDRAPAGRLVVEVDLGDGTPFTVTIEDGDLGVARAAAPEADVRLTTTPSSFAALVWHDAPLDSVARSGSRRALQRFLRCFALPG